MLPRQAICEDSTSGKIEKMRLRDPVDTACRFLVPRISALSGGISSNEKRGRLHILLEEDYELLANRLAVEANMT